MGGWRKVTGTRVAAIAALVLYGAAASMAFASTGTATLAFARIEPHKGALELHFGFRASAPRWKLRTQGDELIIDLFWTNTELPARPLFGQEVAPLKTVRVIGAGPAKTRIAIEVDGKTDYAIARLDREIVLRLAAAGTVPNIAAPILVRNADRRAAAKLASRPPAHPEPVESELPAPSIAQREREASASASAERAPQLAVANEPDTPMIGHPLVMIDPGHGGFDPGTISSSGLEEKDLALAIAARLRRALETRGMRVQMTRDNDVFIPLPERTRIANRANADLFVSIHLNSSPNPAASGIEVYYLNNTTDRATIRLARMENAGAPAGYGTGARANLNYILTDLRQQYKATEAASLARMIDDQAVANLDAGMGLNVNALGAKMGPFYVLVGAHMPAVLVETGFLSNASEAQRLASPQYQELLADGIATAITHYFSADVAVGNL